ncbi:hypothetical protein MUG87_05260 [Ectobacillus sp. JY-23]|uniref:hypothetical protein n=1 Tax=Ectobacillus sp. JY-23 TaxID=2933872 RepID=UPI001FF4D683|nr:hypothetical protein [Ectobacillus sp. JY-23]UOY93533.1 hypothetical protein MUG87_05260 [Ectobacillus sp. JY-23]
MNQTLKLKQSDTAALRIIVMKEKGDVKVFGNVKEHELIVNLLSKAERVEADLQLAAADYTVTIEREHNKELYELWIHNEDRRGWIKKNKEKELYVLSKEDTAALVEFFAFPEQTVNEMPMGEVSNKDLQLIRFIIVSNPQVIQYKVTYQVSHALYNTLAAQPEYYLKLTFPTKIQNTLGIKEGTVVKGEQMKNGYRQYEIQFTVPCNLSEAQRKAIERYYEGYNLFILDYLQHIKGEFPNIIEIVKEHGMKMDLKR